MTVFIHELKRRLKGMVIWQIVMLLFMLASMTKYDTFKDGGQAVEEMISAIPSSLQAMFGMTGLDISSVSGYVGICLIFIVVMVAIYAGLMGASVVADEEIDRTSEFLYPKPAGRTKILFQKLLVVLIGISSMAVTVYLSILISTAKYNVDAATHEVLLQYSLAALIIMLLFGSLGLFLASAVKYSARGVSLLSMAVVVSYFAYATSKMSDSLDWLKYVSVFRWFDAKDILSAEQVDSALAILALGLVAVFSLAAFLTFRRRDIVT